jgi:hypothetical protein
VRSASTTSASRCALAIASGDPDEVDLRRHLHRARRPSVGALRNAVRPTAG